MNEAEARAEHIDPALKAGGRGVEELDTGKLTPLLKLRYHDSLADAVADLGRPEDIGQAFNGFQRYLYEGPPAARGAP
jgi:hypothetical protein